MAAIKLGAFDYLIKPFSIEELSVVVQSALETTKVKRQLHRIISEEEEKYGLDKVIAISPKMREVMETVKKVAISETTTVLLQGETGTGKDLIAKVIHFASKRSKEPYIAITFSALPDNLIESELFGYERGAFTDAKTSKRGLFETGSGGTVYLDEIGDVKPSLQVKLLRLIEGKTFRRLGGTKDITVDVRIIAATNQELLRLVKEGQFREDLYFRLSIVPITIPPLRERREEIIPLAEFFIESFSKEYKKRIRKIHPMTKELLVSYNWPGNVRELKNLIERTMILDVGDEILPEHFSVEIGKERVISSIDIPDEGISLEKLEESLIRKAMEKTGRKICEAAKLLGISRQTFHRREISSQLSTFNF